MSGSDASSKFIELVRLRFGSRLSAEQTDSRRKADEATTDAQQRNMLQSGHYALRLAEIQTEGLPASPG